MLIFEAMVWFVSMFSVFFPFRVLLGFMRMENSLAHRDDVRIWGMVEPELLSAAFIVLWADQVCAWLMAVLLIWQWASWAKSLLQSGVLQPRLVLFSVSDAGNHLLHQIPNKRILGSIVIPEISMVSVISIMNDINHFLDLVLLQFYCLFSLVYFSLMRVIVDSGFERLLKMYWM